MKIVVIAILAPIALFFLYVMALPSATIRYELSIEADVAGVTEIGKGVIQVTYRKIPQFLGSSSSAITELVGEAVVLDLRSGGLLVVLLERSSDLRSAPELLVPIAFNFSQGGLIDSQQIRGVKRLNGKRELPFEMIPLLALFRDPLDPASAQPVDPQSLPTVANATLKRVSVTIVDSGVWPLTIFNVTGTKLTAGASARLPWINDQSQLNLFWKTLRSRGGPPNSSVAIGELFKRGI